MLLFVKVSPNLPFIHNVVYNIESCTVENLKSDQWLLLKPLIIIGKLHMYETYIKLKKT